MKLTLIEWTVLTDTLMGSLTICDGDNLFNYTNKCRRDLMEAIVKRSDEVTMSIEIEKTKGNE